ncbi:hypothetical protein G6514_009324 [Epicoccum nigrum]|nr:hypothetical protein G6514_009324 [Epicoccum nigrum]
MSEYSSLPSSPVPEGHMPHPDPFQLWQESHPYDPPLEVELELENFTYNLTMEESPYTDADVAGLALDEMDSHDVWYPTNYYDAQNAESWVDMKSWADVPSESLEALFSDHFLFNADAGLYDYMVALHAGGENWVLPGSLPHMCDCPDCSDYTLKESRAAYSFEDRSEWNAEEHAIFSYGLPPWYLHVPGVAHGEEYILEPQFSQSDLRALLSEHDYEEWMDTKYECAAVSDAMGIDPGDVDLKLLVPYNEKEYGMSEDCLIALEQYYVALHEADKEYSYQICLEALLDTNINMWNSNPTNWIEDPNPYDWLVKLFGPNKSYPSVSYEQQIELKINSGLIDLTLFEGLNIDLLALPINAEAATHYNIDPDPKAFVEKLEVVDTSTIPAADMRCLHCWSDFGKADDELIELKNGSVQADNSPVKMPCSHGHLIVSC